MSISDKLDRMNAEADDKQGPFSNFDERTLAKMILYGPTHKFILPHIKLLEPDLFDGVPEQAVWMAAWEYHLEHGVLPSDDHAKELVGAILNKWSVSDKPPHKEVKKILLEPIDPNDVPGVVKRLKQWVTHRRWRRLFTGDEAQEALIRGDYDALRDLIAEVEAPDEDDKPLPYFSSHEWRKTAKARDHMTLAVPELQQCLGRGGPSRGEVLCYLGRTNVGKTWCLLNDAIAAARAGHKVLVISLEMEKDLVGERLDSVLTGLRPDQLSEQEELIKRRVDKIFKQLNEQETLEVKRMTMTMTSTNHIRSYIKSRIIATGFRPDIIVVDYLDLMTPRSKSRRSEDEYARQRTVAEDLRTLAIEEQVLIITATQSNREGAKAEKDVGLANVADSFAKVMSLDYVVSINQTEEEYTEGVMTKFGRQPVIRLLVVKNRNGDVHRQFRCVMLNKAQIRPVHEVMD